MALLGPVFILGFLPWGESGIWEVTRCKSTCSCPSLQLAIQIVVKLVSHLRLYIMSVDFDICDLDA